MHRPAVSQHSVGNPYDEVSRDQSVDDGIIRRHVNHSSAVADGETLGMHFFTPSCCYTQHADLFSRLAIGGFGSHEQVDRATAETLN
jgi:hypothetical protein